MGDPEVAGQLDAPVTCTVARSNDLLLGGVLCIWLIVVPAFVTSFSTPPARIVAGLIMAASLAGLGAHRYRMTRILRIDAAGLHFRSWSGTLDVPFDALIAVRRPPLDWGTTTIIWTTTSGRIRTLSAAQFVGFDLLLARLRQASPATTIEL